GGGGDAGVKRMSCPRHRAGTCPMVARVPYAVAERAVAGVVDGVLANYPQFVSAAVAHMRDAIGRMARAVPDEADAERKRVAEDVEIPGKKRGYVRIRFRVDGWPALIRVLAGKVPASVLKVLHRADPAAGRSEEFVIDLGAPTDMDLWGPKIVQWRKEKRKW